MTSRADAPRKSTAGFQGQIPPVEPLLTEVIATLALAAHAYLTESEGREPDLRSAEVAIDVAGAAFERVKERLATRRTVSDHADADRNPNDVRSKARHLRCLACIRRFRRPGSTDERRLVLNFTYEALNVTSFQRAVKMIFAGKAEMLHGARPHSRVDDATRCACRRSSACSTTSAGRCRRSR